MANATAVEVGRKEQLEKLQRLLDAGPAGPAKPKAKRVRKRARSRKARPGRPAYQELLLKAIKVLRDGHWIKREFTDGHGGYCSIGAINRAAQVEPRLSPYRRGAKRALAAALLKHPAVAVNRNLYDGSGPGSVIASVNDNVLTSKDEAIEYFKLAAKAKE